MDRERLGTLLVITSGVFMSLQPIVGKLGGNMLHPVFLSAAAAVSVIMLLLPVTAWRGTVSTLFSRRRGPHLFLIGFFSTVWTTLFLFYGAQLTTGINAALLIQIEPVYAMILGYAVLREQVSFRQVGWTLVLVAGAGIVAYNGSLTVKTGDILVLIAPIGWVIGSMYAKRLTDVDADTIVAGRFFYASLILLVLLTVLEVDQFHLIWNKTYLFAVLAAGIIYATGLAIFYRGLHRINMSKATALLLPTMAVSGVVFAWPVLGEVPSLYQIGGGFLIVIGLYGMNSVESKQRG